MNRLLDGFVDKGCWISHDRVYAFISAREGITEIGYHGLQPVSKNSRVLVCESGVLSFAIRRNGKELPLQTSVVDWQPSLLTAKTAFPEGSVSLTIGTIGRTLKIQCHSYAADEQVLMMRIAKSSFFTDVHGIRTWTHLRNEGNVLRCSFRDRIALQAWLDRTGPYAGDFLIPEPIRKKIFRTSRRSGQATRDDLRPEFRSNDLMLYDSETFVEIHATGFSISESESDWLFVQSLSTDETAELTVRFSDAMRETAPERIKSIVSPAQLAHGNVTRPSVRVEGYGAITEFVQTIPGLVDSCIVQDYGMPRACPGRYYWIWAWDSLVSMMEALRWGDSVHVSSTVRFIQDHRDEQGVIPARWTRSLEPLDTPSPGGIEFLHLALAYEAFLESGDRDLLLHCIPSFKQLLWRIGEHLTRDGLVYGEGFYPDLLASFGRNEQSAVSMEVGSLYAFCRIMENIGQILGDTDITEKARTAAESAASRFSRNFWDTQSGFFVDTVDPLKSSGNNVHPLFALLCLQSPLGMPLIRPHLKEAASFISSQLMTEAGIRVIPLGEAGPNGETVLDSWYPHWDLYALRILRRAGEAQSIVRWLKRVEETLNKLGYCPEFLSLRGFRERDPKAWEHHGSASNLNCVTSWLRCIRESVVGFEIDPGGITHIPLSLPIGTARYDGVYWRRGTWSFRSDYGGPFLNRLTVDGIEIEGTAKIPANFHTPGNHSVQAQYGSRSPSPYLTEIINARVLQSARRQGAVEVEIDPLGSVEVAFFSPDLPRLQLNGSEIVVQWDHETGMGYATFPSAGPCTLRLDKG